MKTSNDYAQAFGRLYDRTPKAVFAAVAMSYAIRVAGAEEPAGTAIAEFLHEWTVLNQNGIIPQKPAERAI